MTRMSHLACFCMILLLAAGGCNDANKQGGALTGAMTSYNEGRYAAAREEAVSILRDASGTERETAAYIAGVSAYQLDDPVDAERWLLTSAQSADSTIAGRSKATLGLIRLDQGRQRDGAVLLRDASTVLSGNEASEAAYRSGVAFQQAGDTAAAEAQFAAASHSVASTYGPGSPNAGGFAIQVGAFQDYANAESAAGEVRPAASRLGLGEVRIIPRRDQFGGRRRTLYVVQIGRFDTRAAADRALQQLGRPRMIVAPVIAGS